MNHYTRAAWEVQVQPSCNKSWGPRRWGLECWTYTLTCDTTRLTELSAVCTGCTLWCSASTNCTATGPVLLKFIIYVMDSNCAYLPQMPEILVITLHLIWLEFIGHQQKTYTVWPRSQLTRSLLKLVWISCTCSFLLVTPVPHRYNLYKFSNKEYYNIF